MFLHSRPTLSSQSESGRGTAAKEKSENCSTRRLDVFTMMLRPALLDLFPKSGNNSGTYVKRTYSKRWPLVWPFGMRRRVWRHVRVCVAPGRPEASALSDGSLPLDQAKGFVFGRGEHWTLRVESHATSLVVHGTCMQDMKWSQRLYVKTKCQYNPQTARMR